MAILEEQYVKLTNQNISEAIERLEKIGEKSKADLRILPRTLLAVEEVMLEYRDAFGEDTELRLFVRKTYSRLMVCVEVPGAKMNPFESVKNNENSLADYVLDSSTKYSYKYSVNRVAFVVNIDSSKETFLLMFLAIFIGLIFGALGPALLNDTFPVVKDVCTRVSDTILKLLQLVSTPVVFLCVIQGVLGSGSIDSFRRNGKTVLKRYFTDNFILLVIATFVAIMIFNVKVSMSSGKSDGVTLILDSIFSVFPSNIIEPFLNGDSVKTVILGLFIGIAIIVLKDRSPVVVDFIYETRSIFILMMEWIVKLMPILIATTLMTAMWSGSIKPEQIGVWKIATVYVGVSLFALLLAVVRLAFCSGYSIVKIIKAIAPIGIRGFLTASSLSLFTDMENTLINDLGVPEEEVNFSLPLSIAFYQPIVMLYSVMSLYFIASAGIEVGPSWMVSFLLICYMIAVSAPQNSGGSAALLMVLFTATGIPTEYLSLAVPVFMLMDYPNTGTKVQFFMVTISTISHRNARKQ